MRVPVKPAVRKVGGRRRAPASAHRPARELLVQANAARRQPWFLFRRTASSITGNATIAPVPVRDSQFVVDEYLAAVRRRPVALSSGLDPNPATPAHSEELMPAQSSAVVQLLTAESAIIPTAAPDAAIEDTATEYDPQLAQARALFDQVDSNRDGLIDAAELDALARLLGTPLQPDQIQSALAQIDRDGDELINCNEFEHWWLLQMSMQDRSVDATALGSTDPQSPSLGSDQLQAQWSDESSPDSSDSSDSLDSGDSKHFSLKSCEDVSSANELTIEDTATEYDPQLAQARALFRQIDSNRDGLIDAAELDVLARLLGTPLQPDQIQSALAQIDRDGDELINCNEFEHWWLLQMSMQDRSVDATALGSTDPASFTGDKLLADKTPQQIAADKIAQHLNQLTSSGTVESTQGQRHTGVTPIALERGPSAGCLSIEKLSAVALPDAVSIGAMDLEAEYVTICNLSSSEVSLDGWALFSARGQQRHLLPNDVVLKSGEKLVVWSGPRADGGHDTPGVQHLVWSGRNMWNDDGDSAMLIDQHGSVLDQVSATLELEQRAEVTPAKASLGSLRISSLDVIGEVFNVQNSSETTISLAGWTVQSAAGGQTYRFLEDCSLAPNAEISVRSGPRILESVSIQEEGKDRSNALIWTQRHVWNNKGDVAILRRPDGREAARCTALIRTHAKRPLHLSALPDQVSIAKLDLVHEYALVVNSSVVAVSLHGWVLESSRGAQLYQFASDLQLPPGGCVLVTSGSEEIQASALAEVRAEVGDGTLVQHVSWTKRHVWNNEGDTARLLGPEQKVVDEVESGWSEEDSVVSRYTRPHFAETSHFL